jgi:putative hydrolase of the HAD superfamily
VEDRVGRVDWQIIDTVLLDMDGTLLDLHFDDWFFTRQVPEAYAHRHLLPPDVALQQVLAAYRAAEGRLEWYDIDYWSHQLSLDIPAMKRAVADQIRPRPHMFGFLQALRASGRRVYLVTNAHARALEIKLDRVPLAPWLDGIATSHDYGYPKEHPAFWPALRERIPFHRASTLLIDDSEPVLTAARQYGIHHLLHVATPSSSKPASPSTQFTSFTSFDDLMPMTPVP